METRKKVGMLFQAGALFDSMTVCENVAFALREHTDWDEAQVAARVARGPSLVELEDVEDLMPADLSGGMRKRVALARAIALAPRAILYDEPTTGLDPITANTINRADPRACRGGWASPRSWSPTTSSRPSRVADRIAFLHEGQILFHGTTRARRQALAGAAAARVPAGRWLCLSAERGPRPGAWARSSAWP